MKTGLPSNGAFSCLHTHTLFCDGKDDVETMCAAAYAQGLRAIGFSSHAPITARTGITTNWHMPESRLKDYIDDVQAARRRWEEKLPVFLGLELDYIKGLRCALDADIQALKLDYIIGSVHYLAPANGAEPFTIDGPPEELKRGLDEGFGGSGEALMHAYWDAVLEMIALGGFDILGHVDLVKKNNTELRFFDSESGAYWERCIEVVSAASRAAKTGLVVEVNTGGMNRGKVDEPYPSLPLLRLFAQAGVPAVITPDAHCAAHVDGNYNEALRLLTEAGYSGCLPDHLLSGWKKEAGLAVPPLFL
jgi:histidinol-phosphatase (PHP family)